MIHASNETRRVIRVFLASPSDVETEREVVVRVTEELNRTVAREHGLIIELFRWEVEARPAMGRPQQVINDQAGNFEQYDLFVGVMWSKFGTPTGRAGSGTEEEFKGAVESFENVGRPQIMFYFGQMPLMPSKTEDAEQLQKMLSFKAQNHSKALWWDYGSVLEFERLFREHVTRWLLAFDRPTPTNPEGPGPDEHPQTSAGGKATVIDSLSVSDSALWVLVHQSFLYASQVVQANKTIHLEIPVGRAAKDSAIKSIISTVGPVAFAHGNDACLAEVIKFERRTSLEGVTWILDLAVKDDFSGRSSMEMGTDKVSADKIAELRARRILLNENFVKTNSGENVPFTFPDGFLQTMVTGVNTTIRVERGVFPDLAHEIDPTSQDFPRLARLSAVFYLRASNTVFTIDHLELELLDINHLRVSFRGRRPKTYSNVDPPEIQVEGVCDLTS